MSTEGEEDDDSTENSEYPIPEYTMDPSDESLKSLSPLQTAMFVESDDDDSSLGTDRDGRRYRQLRAGSDPFKLILILSLFLDTRRLILVIILTKPCVPATSVKTMRQDNTETMQQQLQNLLPNNGC